MKKKDNKLVYAGLGLIGLYLFNKSNEPATVPTPTIPNTQSGTNVLDTVTNVLGSIVDIFSSKDAFEVQNVDKSNGTFDLIVGTKRISYNMAQLSLAIFENSNLPVTDNGVSFFINGTSLIISKPGKSSITIQF